MSLQLSKGIIIFYALSQTISTSIENPQELVPLLPQWAVESSVSSTEQGLKYCLLASGNISIVLMNKTWTVPIDAKSQGECGNDLSELSLRWLDPDSGDKNVLNLFISRMGRLAGISSVFARLQQVEMSVQIDLRDYNALIWPIRYGLSCSRSLQYPLYPAPSPMISSLLINGSIKEESMKESKSDRVPVATLVLDSFHLEAFREATQEDQYLDPLSQVFTRQKWECEFHKTFDWAPFVVGAGIALLVAFMLGYTVFSKRRSLIESEEDRKFKYEKF